MAGQIGKIVRSERFTGSEVLRNLLTYLGRRAAEHPGESAKEYEIAVNVFGREPDFDSRVDSAVRVHAARLRARLAEYYMHEGAHDPILIEVPKGGYYLTWRERAETVVVPEQPMAPEIPVSPAPSRPVRSPWIYGLMGFATAAALAAIVWATLPAGRLQIPAAVKTFWSPFLGDQPEPLVVFSNHRFVGTSSTSLRLYQDGVDPTASINETYSGTGTVMAIHLLDGLFRDFHRPIRLKRAELLTWDEAQATNLVLLGSPESNSTLRQLHLLKQFDFKSSRVDPQVGTAGIRNLHPRPGEESVYFSSGHPYTFDYALVALLPGMRPGRTILIIGGTNTYGLQAATDFTDRSDLLGDLLNQLQVRPGERMPYFEALLHVTINGGVPVHTKIVLARRHDQ